MSGAAASRNVRAGLMLRCAMPRDSVIPADTAPDAHRVQAGAYREMGGAARVRIAFDLSDFARRLTEAGIRRRHPEYTAKEIMRARARVTMGDKLTRAAWPASPLLDP